MTEGIKEAAAGSLIAAAATAMGPCPINGGAGEWEKRVLDKALSMARMIPAVVERFDVLASCQPVTGVIVKVEEIKGRGVITTHATMGTPQANQEVVGGRAVEQFRTAWLNEPSGKALFDLAVSLVGRHCRFGKRTEQIDASKKVRMLEWIEELGPDPATGSSSTAPTRTPPPSQSDRSPKEGDWFVLSGWRDKAQHDLFRREVADTLRRSSELIQSAFRVWVAKKGYEIERAWPSEQAMLMKAKLLSLMDDEERLELAMAGGGPVYAPGEEPF